MCSIIIINRGEKEIGTPREFLEYFGFMPDKDVPLTDEDMDCCLCGCDVSESLIEHNIEFLNDGGDIYVGQLNDLQW